MKKNTLNVRFVSKEEGQMLIQGNTQYYNRLSQVDIDWRVRKENATLDELKTFAKQQVLDFTQREMELVMSSVNFIEHRFDAFECQLPLPEEIVFVKTTMNDEGNASAYTSGNMIFLSDRVLCQNMSLGCILGGGSFVTVGLNILISHELFHCLTRRSPEFRRKMYALIGFTVMDHDIEFPEHIRRMIMANPDVEHIDNYAEFTINGVKRKCALITYYGRSWAECSALQGKPARFFNCTNTALVPIDDLSTHFAIHEASDFWEIMGRNTDYVAAPEECLAVNFSYAVVLGPHRDYKSPQLIKAILDALNSHCG